MRLLCVVGAFSIACASEPGLPPCDVDEDCASGSHCVTGRGCDFECRRDVDCLAYGGGVCD
ncbi:MAG: hypothetical protein K8H88_09835, partial [Sandaracinaceae bacterium]|nr:hypothetical protein [Sandaracinaceae bacterium]